MITIGEAIQRLQSIYSQGVQSNNTRLSKRQIYSNLLSGRNTLIEQISNKNQYINAWMYQTLHVVELEKVSMSSVSGIGKTNVLKSKKRIPVIISDMDYELYSSVTKVDGSVNYSATTYHGDKYKVGAKYSFAKGNYYIKDGFFYMTGAEYLKGVTMNAIFEDPLEVFQFNYDNCKDCECVAAEDIEFPIDRKLLKTMMEFAYQELVLFVQMNEDRKNNAQDDAKPSKMIHQ